MKKKMVSIIMSAVIAATVAPMLTSVKAEAGIKNPLTSGYPNPLTYPNFRVVEETNIYEAPDSNSKVIGKLKFGNSFKDCGQKTDKDNNTWYKIKASDFEPSLKGLLPVYGYVKCGKNLAPIIF